MNPKESDINIQAIGTDVFTDAEVRELLREECRKTGSETALARKNEISQSVVNDVINQKRPIGATIERVLGIERVWRKRLTGVEDALNLREYCRARLCDVIDTFLAALPETSYLSIEYRSRITKALIDSINYNPDASHTR